MYEDEIDFHHLVRTLRCACHECINGDHFCGPVWQVFRISNPSLRSELGHSGWRVACYAVVVKKRITTMPVILIA